MPSDYVSLLNMAFAPSHGNTAKNLELIAKGGVSPFTKALLEHPGVFKGSNESLLRRSIATDAAAAAAGVDAGAITGLSTIRAVAVELRSKSRRSVGGMELEDDDLHLDDLPETDAEELGFMGNCKARGGAVFAVGQATGDTESCVLAGANFRVVAERIRLRR